MCTQTDDFGSPGVCDGHGYCVSGEMNPCAVHGCGGKSCGDECLQGDIMGLCDENGICEFNPGNLNCGIFILWLDKIPKLLFNSY